MTFILDHPFISIAIVWFLAFLDYPLTVFARKMYKKYMAEFVEYDVIKQRSKPSFGWLWVSIKVVIGLLLYGIWIIYHYGELEILKVFYLWLVGFASGSYFIINLRHIESIFLSCLYTGSNKISGKITYHSNMSIKISAIQIFSVFLIFSLFFIITPNYLTLGLTCAPFFLTVRNLILS